MAAEQSSTPSVRYKLVHEIHGFEAFVGYRVGDDGLVWSRWRKGGDHALTDTWRLARPGRNRTGYLQADLHANGQRLRPFIHRLVLEAFVGPRPDGMDGCHNNGNPADNRLSNLRWDTKKANAADALAHGTRRMGSRVPLAKLDESKVVQIRTCLAAGRSCADVAREFGVSKGNIWLIAKGDTWRNVAPGEPVKLVGNNARRGDQNASARLTESDVRAVRLRYAVGESQSSIARSLGVAVKTISRIVHGRGWRHIA